MTICVDCGNEYNEENVFRVDSTVARMIGRERANHICNNCAYNFQDLKAQMMAESACMECSQYPCVCDLIDSHRDER
jgi:hypothetical protein